MKQGQQKLIPVALTIAGSDSSGGAGIQADLKSFSANGVYGASVITSLTAQNTIRVKSIHSVSSNFIEEQIETVFEDLNIQAIKIGMLENSAVVESVTKSLKKVKAKNIVLDTVMVAKSGDRLLKIDAVQALKTLLIPIADIITPNIPEAADLLSREESDIINSMNESAMELYKLGAKSVLLKAGHLSAPNSNDLFYDGKIFETLSSKKYNTKNTHGTGCTLSAAIASYLAKGETMNIALKKAKSYVSNAIKNSAQFQVGKGKGPLHHFFDLWKEL